MPPLEATEMIEAIEIPPYSSKKAYERHQGTTALRVGDWTATLFQQFGSSFRSSSWKDSASAMMAPPSPATRSISAPSPQNGQSRKTRYYPSASSPSPSNGIRKTGMMDNDDNSSSEDSSYNNRKTSFSSLNSSPPPPTTNNAKRKVKGRSTQSVALFVYMVALSLVLLLYTEYQLWQLSSTTESHNNILPSTVQQMVRNQTTTTRSVTTTSQLRPSSNVDTATTTTMTIIQNRVNDVTEQQQPQQDDDDNGSSTEDTTILQIIHSRFMQNQPNLLHLGQARLRLFKHFFLRSLEEQSSPNFCCIIRTDPELHPTLKEQLVTLLQASNLTYILIASNETPKSQYQVLMDGNTIRPSDVWSGSLPAVKRYLRLDDHNRDNNRNATLPTNETQRQPSRMIETRLDADDGLHRYFVETIQAEAEEKYPFNPKSWHLWCVANHVEWQYQTIWKKNPLPTNDTGTLVALQVNYCVTPGLSIAYLGDDESLESLPSTMNHEKLMHTRMCKEKRQITDNCRSFLPMTMGAIRARTPTSAGMLNLVYNGTANDRKYIRGASKQKEIQGQLWWAARKFFNFTKKEATSINEYLNSNMKVIAEENLLGQCTKGHSCKNSSQILLKSIVEAAA